MVPILVFVHVFRQDDLEARGVGEYRFAAYVRLDMRFGRQAKLVSEQATEGLPKYEHSRVVAVEVDDGVAQAEIRERVHKAER